MQTTQDTLSIVQRIISEVSGTYVEVITQDADPSEDLDIDLIQELPIILARIKKETGVALSIEAFRNCGSIAELVEMIDEERDL